jgi:hypothetical protein
METDDYDQVEGAGSRIREGGFHGEEADGVFDEIGLPMKEDSDDE